MRVYVIEKAWIDPMENHNAAGYNPIGFVTIEEEAKKIIRKGGYFTPKDCWIIRSMMDERMPKFKYYRLELIVKKKDIFDECDATESDIY